MSIDDCRIIDVALLRCFLKTYRKDGLDLIWLEFIIDENMIKNDLVDP